MKILEALNAGGITVYVCEYDYGRGGCDEWKSYDDYDAGSLQEVFETAKEDLRYELEEGKLAEGILFAFGTGEPEFEQDYDGHDYSEIIHFKGEAMITAQQPLPPNHPAFKKVEQMMEQYAASDLEGWKDGEADRREYNRDPYAYYGVKRSDFH